jgi:3-hydroxybutyryl-CoA dehydrogenase
MQQPQQTVGVIGLGLLGRGIAACLVASGIRVVGFTSPAAGFAPARQSIGAAIDELIAHGELSASMQSGWQDLYSEAQTLQDLRSCTFVIESIPEDLVAKNQLFEELEKVIADTAPIASNTSSIPISLLQAGKRNPRRFVGMHWLSPCHVTRFLEIIRGDQTDDRTIQQTLDLARRAGKDPSLVRKDIAGFIVNRLAYALYREAFHLLELGVADIETIDRTARNVLGLWAPIAGPFRWMDLTGLASYASSIQRLWPTLSNAATAPAAIRSLVEQGHHGADTGRGFYEYSADEVQRWRAALAEQAWNLRRMRPQSSALPDPVHPDPL